MAMVTRSDRAIDFAGRATNSVVGPGYYDYQTATETQIRPNFASFGSSMSRNRKNGTSSIPGPGAYLSSNTNTLVVNNSNKYGSNAFTTTVPRMAPMCPGATPFQNPSSIENPGPGTYEMNPTMRVKAPIKSPKSQDKKQLSSSRLIVAPSFNPPTVPSTLSKGPFVASRGFADTTQSMVTQSLGNSESVVSRTALKPKDTSKQVYSGIGVDTVGPCEYNPNPSRSGPVIDFSRSQPRISSSLMSKQDTPGPGTYVLPSSLNAVARPPLQGLSGFNPGHYQTDAPNGRSSFFASTAPRVGIVGTGTSEDVGPGAYVGTGGMGDSLMTDPIWIEKQYKQSVSGFGSGSSHRASFLNLSKHSNKPGPGQYGTRSDFDYEPSDSLGSAGAVGFNCSGARSCIPHAPEQVIRTSKSAPGPGDYDLEKVNSLANGYERARKLTLGRNGVFGGSGERFNTHDSASVLPEHLGGDVSYANNTSVPKGSRLGPDMSDAVMQGAGARGKQPPQHKGRLLRTHLGSYARLPQVTPRGTMVEEHDLGGYSLKKAQDYRGLRDAPPSLPTHNPSSLDTRGGVGVWSKTTEARFSEDTVMGRPIANTPGPSRYQTDVSSFKTNKKNPNATVNSFSSGERFKQPSALVNPNIGPGVYSTSQNWVKKSYNITYVAPTKM